jgi:hypothetical protein
MIISPPFLPPRAVGCSDADYVAAAMPSATINCPGTSVPEGSFPVSLKLGWHGGTHLHAPSTNGQVLPLRAIADGEIVYARQPTTRVSDPAHPLNYNPYGDAASWTDDGMVIIRHRTDIGTGRNAEAVEFYSLFAHLSALRGNALKVAKGTASDAERRLFRKDEFGTAGKIYNAADHLQMEILCDDDNLRKLVGRTGGRLGRGTDGRSDAVYGEVYFHVPAGARLYTAEPAKNVAAPEGAAAETTTTDLIIGIRYASGDGEAAQRGSAWVSTYQSDGTILGVPLEEQKADYDMYTAACDIVKACPAGGQPAPSAVYEMLRFGRVLNGPNEVLAPADCPHWRKVRGGAQVGWINLNAGNVRKFSDADFPDWKGWSLIDDDVDGDSRAQSPLLRSVIGGDSPSQSPLSAEEQQRRMSLPEIRTALARCICKTPSEWARDSIDARWGWLQSDPEQGVAGDDWARLRGHTVALTVPASSLPASLNAAHWHFQPQAFITHFRKCQWLAEEEFKQLIPMHAMRSHAGRYLWEAVRTNLTAPTSVFVSQRIGLNRMTRKYGINSPLRLASFYGNAIQETQWMGLLSEGSGSTLWYTPWYGRGFLQLTNPGNFIDYWRFRGRQVPEALRSALTSAFTSISDTPSARRSNAGLNDGNFPQLTAQMRGWRDEVRGVAAENSTDSGYAPSDSAGFYWAKLGMASFADVDHVLNRVAVTTNEGAKVYYRSPSFWRASAAVNLPRAVDSLYSPRLNGFDARCVAYAYSLAVLSENLFPDRLGNFNLRSPEGYLPRRS